MDAIIALWQHLVGSNGFIGIAWIIIVLALFVAFMPHKV